VLADGQCWLLLLDACGVGDALAARLEAAGQTVVRVASDATFASLAPLHYTLDPSRPADYATLLAELQAQNLQATRVVHLLSVTPPPTTAASATTVESALEHGFYSLLCLAQALGQQTVADPIHLTVITSNTQAVTGAEVICPEKAPILGPCKVIPQEYPHLTCRSIDIVAPSAGAPLTRILDLLFAELATPPSETTLAYRGNGRWIETFAPVSLERDSAQPRKLRGNGVYVVTGGLGNVGFVLSEYLAKAAQAKLVVTGRSALPPRVQWQQWLDTHNEQDSQSQKIRKVQALEAAGAEVLAISADAGNIEQMLAVVTETIKHFGTIHGVIHAAGLAGANSLRAIQESSKANCEEHFQSKGYGLFVLEQVLQGIDLDFCLFLSSIASVLGGIGHATYVAANIFMDAFVQRHNQSHSTPWISVNWDVWEETGQQDQTSGHIGYRGIGATMAELAIRPDEGVEVFQRILGLDGVDQILVSTSDLQARIDQWIKLEDVHKTSNGYHAELHPRPSLGTDYVPPGNQVEQVIADIWQKLLGVNQLGVYDNFFELGGNSLLALKVVARLKQELITDISVVSLFEAPTISALAKLIYQDQSEQPLYETSQVRGERRREKRRIQMMETEA
jgi:NAD(P)-dependent dehydrogenase (short-subunit alcohol dehydrogenase family)